MRVSPPDAPVRPRPFPRLAGLLSLASLLSLFVALMGLSGFFSRSETSLSSLNKLQLEQMLRAHSPGVGPRARGGARQVLCPLSAPEP